MNNGEDIEPIYCVCELNVCIYVHGWFLDIVFFNRKWENIIFLHEHTF